jgi:hypothetical protein
MPPWVTFPRIWFLKIRKNLSLMKSDDSRRLQPVEGKAFLLAAESWIRVSKVTVGAADESS